VRSTPASEARGSTSSATFFPFVSSAPTNFPRSLLHPQKSASPLVAARSSVEPRARIAQFVGWMALTPCVAHMRFRGRGPT
jgi:hypothetical protein